MNPKKIYLTQEGLTDLQKEYGELTQKKRPDLIETLSSARDQGDLSENAEYQAAKQELAFMDGRIEELEDLLKNVSLIAESTNQSGKKIVSLGSTVTVKIGSKEHTYMVVGEWEADPATKKISHESPLGKALIGKSIGESLEVDAPAGKVAYTVVSID